MTQRAVLHTANREFDFVDDSMSDNELVGHLKQLKASNNFVK
jgi:hypothetical protein